MIDKTFSQSMEEIQHALAQLPEDKQIQVEEYAGQIRRLVNLMGDVGHVALIVVVAEVGCKVMSEEES